MKSVIRSGQQLLADPETLVIPGSILIVGIGNSGRADDGLGWEFINKISNREEFDLEYRYQLQVEDAELIASYEQVWFVDASHEQYPDGLRVSKVKPIGNFTYTSHQLSPEVVLFLCQDLFGKFPDTRLIGISGENWNLGEPMSDLAKNGLKKALEFFNQHQIITLNER